MRIGQLSDHPLLSCTNKYKQCHTRWPGGKIWWVLANGPVLTANLQISSFFEKQDHWYQFSETDNQKG